MRLHAAGLALVVTALTAAPAWAADAISPRDGETVGSRPVFQFDFARGFADIELSRTPETRTGGESPGTFVERADSTFVTVGRETPGLALWGTRRIDAGRYFWHVKAEDRSQSDGPQPTWGPTRTLIVRDEAVVFEGWTVRAQRLRARGRCATRVRLRGTVAWSDNATDDVADYSIRLIAGTRTVGRLAGRFDSSTESFDGVVCARRRTTARRFTVSAALRDPGGHLAVGERRQVTVR